jgi:hypothetical protein
MRRSAGLPRSAGAGDPESPAPAARPCRPADDLRRHPGTAWAEARIGQGAGGSPGDRSCGETVSELIPVGRRNPLRTRKPGRLPCVAHALTGCRVETFLDTSFFHRRPASARMPARRRRVRAPRRNDNYACTVTGSGCGRRCARRAVHHSLAADRPTIMAVNNRVAKTVCGMVRLRRKGRVQPP